jgi:eukaryotic-like serine/threonine-protein kinase
MRVLAGTSRPLIMTAIMKAGRYEIVGELGRGAMGVVYKATDPVIGRAVAVKTIRLSEEGTGLSRPELLTRFQTEARAAGLLTHPNIVVVFDAGEEEGLYYITMELVEGKSLQALLDAGHAFPLPRVLRIMEQACSALNFAHERNVVHRDIKPANLMLTPDDTVKVTDFGTAKILQFGTVQQTAHVMGTPSYMSPEQVKGRAVDGRSDIFSLGVLLYEMITGEKPFPGQSITTVIYKIVNEEPVPPSRINPSIHPGISAAVMKALSKEPETRYQTCREMMEDLRNYRALSTAGGNPQATAVMGQATPNATVAMGSAPYSGGLRGMHHDNNLTAATVRSLTSAGAEPLQTPSIRRTATITPYQEPKKRNIAVTIFAALLMLSVIAFGAYKLRPVFQDARQIHTESSSIPASDGLAQAGDSNADKNSVAPNVGAPSPAPDSTSNTAVEISPLVKDGRTVDASAEKAGPKKIDSQFTPKAAEFKQRIEQAIADRGLTGRVKVQGVGNTLILAGKLRPAEHGALLKFLRDTPPDLRVVDHIEYDDSAGTDADAVSAEGSHPVPAAGRGAIHVVTDVIGATAVLHGPAGRALNQCQTPCSFNNLFPAHYSLEVKKDGYEPVETALQVEANGVSDQRLRLLSLASGLLVNSDPAGADIFINGAKQSGQTPATLPLGPGSFNLVLRLQGYEAYAGTVQVHDNVQTQVGVKLSEKSNSRVAFAQVDSNPQGAEIAVDGLPTGQITPSRIEVPVGMHTVTIRLKGFRTIKRTVQVSDGGTVSVSETLTH